MRTTRKSPPRPPGRVSAAVSVRMRAIRTRDTHAERALREALWKCGLRYRLHGRLLRGRPDIVFGIARVAVFVDGDFWHGRMMIEKGRASLARTFTGPRARWWTNKIAYNVRHDREVSRTLRAQGWSVIRIWASDVLTNPVRAARKVQRTVARRTEGNLAHRGAAVNKP